MIKNQFIAKAIDIIGKLLLAWFIFETFLYFYTGRFLQQLSMVSDTFQSGFWGIYNLIQIPVASIGVFTLIYLIYRGHISGLIIGVLYWIMGYITNPFWIILPSELQKTSTGEATSLIIGLNYTWSILTLVIIFCFFLYRRSLRVKAIET